MAYSSTLNPIFLKLSPANWWQLLIDSVDHPIGPKRFEDEEPGYLKSMFSGLNYLLKTLGKPLTPELLIELHDQSVSHTYSLLKTGTDSHALEKFPTGVRGGYAVTFGLVAHGKEQNCTKNGFIELLNRLAAGDTSFYIQDSQLNFKIDSQSIPKPLTPEYIEEAWQQIQIYPSSVNTRCESKAEIIQNLKNKITIYEQNIKQAQTRRQKILAIAAFIHDLEVYHCFGDGNCRTFGVFLSKKLLVDNGFPPAILPYRDRIDAHSTEEIADQLELGIDNYINLENINLPSHTEILYLKNNDYLARYLAEHTLLSMPIWPKINSNEQQRAITLVKEALLTLDCISKSQLKSVTEVICEQVKKSIYKKSYCKQALCFNSQNEYGIYFKSSFDSILHGDALSLDELKAKLSETDQRRYKTGDATVKLRLSFNNLLSDLSRLHHSRKASANNNISHYITARLLAPITTIKTNHELLDSLGVQTNKRTLLYLIFNEFLSDKDFSNLDQETQATLQDEVINFILTETQDRNSQLSNPISATLLSRAQEKLLTSPKLETLLANYNSEAQKVNSLYQPAFAPAIGLPQALCHH